MSVTVKDVEHVASLARLSFTPREMEMLVDELNAVLRYMEDLNSVDTTHVEPLEQVIAAHNVLRPDESRPSIGRAEALKNAPSKSEHFFKVPKVIGDR